MQNLTKITITAKKRKVIPLILQASSISDGCLEAGISRETFYTWLQDPEFRDEFQKQQKNLTDEALHVLKASFTEAVETLKGLLKAEGARGESVRLKASLAIIENVLKRIEVEEIEKRIEALEVRNQQ